MSDIQTTKSIRVVEKTPGMRPGRVLFRQIDEDSLIDTTSVSITTGDWLDMGRPDTLTVTIEPGDRLNAG